MTITSAAGVEFARELGCNLVVLARECSIKEIEKMVARVEGRRSRESPRHPLPVIRHCRWKFLSMARCASPIPANV